MRKNKQILAVKSTSCSSTGINSRISPQSTISAPGHPPPSFDLHVTYKLSHKHMHIHKHDPLHAHINKTKQRKTGMVIHAFNLNTLHFGSRPHLHKKF